MILRDLDGLFVGFLRARIWICRILEGQDLDLSDSWRWDPLNTPKSVNPIGFLPPPEGGIGFFPRSDTIAPQANILGKWVGYPKAKTRDSKNAAAKLAAAQKARFFLGFVLDRFPQIPGALDLLDFCFFGPADLDSKPLPGLTTVGDVYRSYTVGARA